MLSSISHVHFSKQFPFFILNSNPISDPAPSSFSFPKTLEELRKMITTPAFTIEDFKHNKSSIRQILILFTKDEYNKKELNLFFKELIEWGITHNVEEELFSELVDLIDLPILQNLAKENFASLDLEFNSAMELAKEMVHDYPISFKPTFKDYFLEELNKFHPFVIYFIPNLINLFLSIFNLMNNHKKFTSLWEKYLLLEILYKLVLIPYALIQILKPILIVPSKVYLVSALIILSVGLLAIAYKKWIRPLPQSIINCINLDKHLDMRKVKSKVGQGDIINRLIAALMAGSNVLIVGKSGNGKTGLMHRLTQLKKEGKLPKQLQDLRYFSLACASLMGTPRFGHAELIEQTKEEIEGIEKRILMFFDEIDQLTENRACFQTFKQCFLNEDTPNPLFVAATTIKGLEKIEQLDGDRSFMRRVIPIYLESASDTQCRLVLNEYLKGKAKHLFVTDEAVRTVLRLSKSHSYLPHIGRLAKIKEVMKCALGRCKLAFDPCYTSTSLAKARDEYASLEKDATSNSQTTKILQKKRELRSAICKLESELSIQKTQAKKVKDYLHKKEIFLAAYTSLIHVLANSDPNKVKEQNQKKFFLYQLYGENAFKSVINKAIHPIKHVMNVRIDRALIKEIFKDLKNIQMKIKNTKKTNPTLSS